MQAIQSATSDRIAQLLAATPSETAFVPLHKLHRDPTLKSKPSISPRRDRFSHYNSLGSGETARSEDSCGSLSIFSSRSASANSLREVIQDLEEKIKYDQLSGLLHDHLSVKHHMTPDICSWNHKIPKKYRDRARLPVNIIGCHQPAELIVARADERIRRQVMAREVKEKHMDEVRA